MTKFEIFIYAMPIVSFIAGYGIGKLTKYDSSIANTMNQDGWEYEAKWWRKNAVAILPPENRDHEE